MLSLCCLPDRNWLILGLYSPWLLGDFRIRMVQVYGSGLAVAWGQLPHLGQGLMLLWSEKLVALLARGRFRRPSCEGEMECPGRVC